MSKLTLEQIQQSVDTFDLTQPASALGHAWVLAHSYQSRFKPSSDEHKLLAKFKASIDKEHKARLKLKPIYLSPTEEEREPHASQTN